MDVRLYHKRLADAARDLIPQGSAVVCAVSGGADSMALLHGLHATREIHERGWVLRVAHLDHGLREESATDAAFVGRVAASLGVEYCVASGDIAAAVRESRESVEEAGRRLRYEFLERVAKAAGARVVAVGHTADDQAETVLHHIARGTGLRGLAGMRRRRPICEGSDIELVRPLLGFRRAELREYVSNRGLRYREDPTNADDSSTRNRIRHQVLPLLASSVNPEIATALNRLSAHARQAEEAISQIAADALNRVQIRRGDRDAVLSATAMAALPRSIRAEVILLVLRGLGIGLKGLGFERIEAAAEAACGDGRRRRVELPDSATVERRGRELRIRRDDRTGSPPAGRSKPAGKRSRGHEALTG